jgi:glycosyltransferase involved in cell wall biosynthesis
LIEKPAIVTVAGLHPDKGVSDLIEAFAVTAKSIPNLSLYILGEGPAKARLQQQAARLPHKDRIHFQGFIEDPRPFLAQADVFVLASHREAFGLALAEAREARCAVVGTNVGGIPEVLEGGRAGILVPMRNPAELAKTLVRLFSDPQHLERWRNRAADNLSWLSLDRVFRETMTVYAEARRARSHHGFFTNQASANPRDEAPIDP